MRKKDIGIGLEVKSVLMNSIKILFLSVILAGGCTAKADDRIDGFEYIKLTIDEKSYDVVVYEQLDRELYVLLKALEGDETARKVILRGGKERKVFIGDGEKVRWLVITKDGQKIKEL